MPDDVKTLYHMVTAWNAFAAPAVIPPSLTRSLCDYLTSFLKSTEGEKFLRTLGYVRAPAGAPSPDYSRKSRE
jgi:hypothetical protein